METTCVVGGLGGLCGAELRAVVVELRAAAEECSREKECSRAAEESCLRTSRRRGLVKFTPVRVHGSVSRSGKHTV